jgi:hypothetical protein
MVKNTVAPTPRLRGRHVLIPHAGSELHRALNIRAREDIPYQPASVLSQKSV